MRRLEPRSPGVLLFGTSRSLPLLIALLLLTGCMAPGERSAAVGETADEPALIAAPSPPPPGRGRIYFYRSNLPVMLALAPEVIVNGRRVGQAAYETVFYRDARPGRYEVFVASDPDEPIYFSLAAGDLRFVKTVVEVGFAGTWLSAELVEEDKARREIAAQRWAQGKPPPGPRDPS